MSMWLVPALSHDYAGGANPACISCNPLAGAGIDGAGSTHILPPTSLHRKIALNDCRDAIVHNTKNWAWSLHKAMQKVGYNPNPHIACNTMDQISLAKVRQQLQGQLDAHAHWEGVASCPRTRATPGARLCTYENWFAATRPRRNCLRISVSAKTLRLFLRFRTGCHNSPIDKGRRGN